MDDNLGDNYVYIIGAGMTRAAYPNYCDTDESGYRIAEKENMDQHQIYGAPLTKDLLNELIYHKPREDDEFDSHEFVPTYQRRLRNFLKKYNFISPSDNITYGDEYHERRKNGEINKISTTLMELLTFLKMEMRDFNSEINNRTLETDINHLRTRTREMEKIYSITTFLLSNLLHTRLGNGVASLHEEFANHIINNLRKGHKITIVCLNYDLTIENAIAKVIRNTPFKIGYGLDNVEFVRYKKIDQEPDNQDEEEVYKIEKDNMPSFYDVEDPDIQVLKPHGSLNWLVCENRDCLTVNITWGIKSNSRLLSGSKIRCVACDHLVKPSIIAPSFLQRISLYPHNMLYHKIDSALMVSHKFRFIGYSMPDGDYEFKRLLRLAILNNRNFRSRPDIFIINGSFKANLTQELLTIAPDHELLINEENYVKDIKKHWLWPNYRSVFQNDLDFNLDDNPLRVYPSDFNYYFTRWKEQLKLWEF